MHPPPVVVGVQNHTKVRFHSIQENYDIGCVLLAHCRCYFFGIGKCIGNVAGEALTFFSIFLVFLLIDRGVYHSLHASHEERLHDLHHHRRLHPADYRWNFYCGFRLFLVCIIICMHGQGITHIRRRCSIKGQPLEKS